MALRVGINGFGRIGRLAYRAMADDPDIEVVAINDLADIKTMAHLLKYDSVHGRVYDSVEVQEGLIIVDGKTVKVVGEREPGNLPWGELGVDVVVESTGFFTDGVKAKSHIDAGAKKVLISAPGKNVDKTIIMGVNDYDYKVGKDNIVSNASCTSNCLGVMAKVLLANFGIKRGFINAVHAFTNDQRILDLPHKDLRRARSASQSLIPTTTSAARAVSLVLPQLIGKLEGFATRVPTPDGSMVDFTVELGRDVTAAEVNGVMKAAAEGAMKNVLEYTEEPVVSIDVVGNPHSAVFDAGLTMVHGGRSNFVKCVAWYDNEWAYSNRIRDLAKIML
ncbi:MAG: type I glyceraldehyde-3-phosphate dehydrogenase [Eggerthellaceae bacterium]|nr:type I glyceraldehyde-3-phosphate dehydrogenase [Eggerthellaceae bacterium]